MFGELFENTKKLNEAEEVVFPEIDLKPLEEEITKRIGVVVTLTKEIKQGRTGTPYLVFESQELVDEAGVLSAGLETLHIVSFGGGKVSKEEGNSVWWPVHFSFSLKRGGSNSIDFMSAWYTLSSGKWTFRGAGE